MKPVRALEGGVSSTYVILDADHPSQCLHSNTDTSEHNTADGSPAKAQKRDPHAGAMKQGEERRGKLI